MHTSWVWINYCHTYHDFNSQCELRDKHLCLIDRRLEILTKKLFKCIKNIRAYLNKI